MNMGREKKISKVVGCGSFEIQSADSSSKHEEFFYLNGEIFGVKFDQQNISTCCVFRPAFECARTQKLVELFFFGCFQHILLH